MFTFNGKIQKPYVETISGRSLNPETDYIVEWSDKSSKDVGSYTVTISGIGNYTGTARATYKINPGGTSIKKVKRGKKALILKWTKQSAAMSEKRVNGYQIQLASDSRFTKNKKLVTVKGYRKTSKKIAKLKSRKKYFLRVRTFMIAGGSRYYSPWSKAKAGKSR